MKKLLYFFAVCLFVVFCNVARSETYQAIPEYRVPPVTAWSSTPLAAVTAYCSANFPGTTPSAFDNPDTTWPFSFKGSCTPSYTNFGVLWQALCPTGTKNPDGLNCTATCPAGKKIDPTTGLCKDSCPSNQVFGTAGDGMTSTALNRSLNICVAGCQLRANGMMYNPGQKHYEYFGPFTSTGEWCTGTDATTASTPTDDRKTCGADETQIGSGSDGTPLCVKKSDEVKTNNADGSQTTVKTTYERNKDGSTTTITDTVRQNADGTWTRNTTRSTGNTPGGSAGVDDGRGTAAGTSSGNASSPQNPDKEDEKDDMCKDHPELNICKNSTVSGNSCAGEATNISCEGDAIQCNILRQQHKEYCETQALKQKSDYVLGTQMQAGNDPLKTSFPTPTTGTTVNAGSLDVSGGGGSCFQDKTFTVAGRSVTMPFSAVCDYLVALRYAIMVIAALVALKTVGGSVLS